MLEKAIEDNPNSPTLLTLQQELLKKRKEYIVILKSKFQENKYVSINQVLTRVIPYLIPDLEELEKIPFFDLTINLVEKRLWNIKEKDLDVLDLPVA